MTVQADITFSLDGTGWSERYYLNPESDDLTEVARRLVTARQGILAAPAVLQQIRIFDLDRPLFPTVIRYDFVGDFTMAGFHRPLSDDRIPATYAPLCALMCFRTEKGGRRTFHLNGLPSFELKNGDVVRPFFIHFQLVQRLRALRDALGPTRLNLQIQELLSDADAPSSPIDGIDTSGTGLYRIHTRTDFPAADNPQVRVMGSRGNNLGRSRGIRRVTQVEGPRTVVIDRGPLPERGPIRYTGGAVLRAAVYTWSPAVWEPFGAMSLKRVPNTGLIPLPRQLRQTDPLRGEFGIGCRVRGDGQPQKRGRRRAR